MSLDLIDLQKRMAEILTDEEGPKDRSLAFISEGKVQRAARLSVYSEGYFIRLTEALAKDFPATSRAVGHEGFHRLANGYLKRYPSESANIEDVGTRLSTFIVESEWGSQFPFLGELARLEWLIIEAFYAAATPELDVSKLTGITPEVWNACTFVLDPSVRLLKARFPVDEIWRGEATEVREKASFLLVNRFDDEVWVQPLESGNFHLLELVSRGLSFSDICDGCLDVFPSVEDTVTEFQASFATWVSEGLLKDIRVPRI